MSNNSLQAYLNADDKVGLDKFLIPPTKDGRLVSLEARHHRSGADRFFGRRSRLLRFSSDLASPINAKTLVVPYGVEHMTPHRAVPH